MKRIVCWLVGHKLVRIDRSTNGWLEKLVCRRCLRIYAAFHPCQWFGEWDYEDEESLRDLKR